MKAFALAVGKFFHTIIYAPLSLIGYSHPVHPALVHLTIGTIVAAFFFDYLGWIFKKPALRRTARHNLVFAFPSFLVTGCAGLADWSSRYRVVSFNPASNALMFAFGMKFILAGVLLVLFIVTYIFFRRTRENHPWRHLFYLLLFLNVVALGFYGGSIVYG